MLFKRYQELMHMYIMDGEIDEVYTTLNSFGDTAKLVEWGSGGSTIAWLFNMKPTQTFISIEHDITWFNDVSAILEEQKKLNPELAKLNHQYYYIPKTGNIPVGDDVGQFDTDRGCDAYINGPLDVEIWDADVYFVDGLARYRCAENVMFSAKNRNALAYIHDYSSNKDRYSGILKTFPLTREFMPPLSRQGNHMLKM